MASKIVMEGFVSNNGGRFGATNELGSWNLIIEMDAAVIVQLLLHVCHPNLSFKWLGI
ncbi:hypothetical protein COLO4_10200 [Corchorus olitorius]|uniref:Uncharacterized protein n=1 Tax=Corchorus olitorius TaxID=93759 RepID=A0A1R3K9L6_9ROSI|nr:hypothetical protein COLO4_10200 [Corchorus olitorius]